MVSLLKVTLKDDNDVVQCRQRAKQIAALLGLDHLNQTQIATAVSEIARNALKFAGSGQTVFELQNVQNPRLYIQVQDQGPGIADVWKVLESPQGMGLKISRRLMDSCEIHSSPETGTQVILMKALDRTMPLDQEDVNHIIDQLLQWRPGDAISEVRAQNSELVLSLDALRKQQDLAVAYQRLLEDLNKELADTNRGVIALNSELEDQSKAIQEASEVKARFLSHVTHEFRTPVNSILSMSRILLAEHLNLDTEQLKQVAFIRQAAEGLSEMVNDLLDTVKIDAQKLTINRSDIVLAEVFDTLKAMFKPLLTQGDPVELVFEDVHKIDDFVGDETKLSQILRNFISNALKFTLVGEVRVSARLASASTLAIAISDTGLGIAPEYQDKIFEEFYQVLGVHQKRAKGTGLGLPLARKLARLLEGEISLESTLGQGSTFTLRLPYQKAERANMNWMPKSILVIDDEESTLITLKDAFRNYPANFSFARSGAEGLALAASSHPDLIILDVNMPLMNGYEVLDELKKNTLTASLPVVMNSSLRLTLDDFSGKLNRPDLILQKDRLSVGQGFRPILQLLNWEKGE